MLLLSVYTCPLVPQAASPCLAGELAWQAGPCASAFICIPKKIFIQLDYGLKILPGTFSQKYNFYGSQDDHQVHENGHVFNIK